MVTIKKDGPSLDAEFDTHNIQPKMDLETLSTKKKKKKDGFRNDKTMSIQHIVFRD